MRRGVSALFAVAVILLAAVGCESRPHNNAPARPEVEIEDYTAEARHHADSLLQTLSLEQKAGMLFMPALFTRTDAATVALLKHYAVDLRVGGIILLKGDTLSARILADSLSRWGRDDIFIAIDAEWGLAMRFDDAPRYPANGDLPAETSEEQMFDYGSKVAALASRLGINMILGPVLDVTAEGVPSYIGKRSFGSDPARASHLGCAYARGVYAAGVLPVAKHFPGQGSLRGDSHSVMPVLAQSLQHLDSIDLQPFADYIDAGFPAIMIGHMAVPAIDPEMRPASLSPAVMTDLLRGDMGFKGLIITDALNMGGAQGGNPADAIAAGADLVIAPVSTELAIRDIVEAVKSGRLSQSALDDRCRRILYYLYPLIIN